MITIDIDSIEDKIIETIENLNKFNLVLSAGRKDLPKTLKHPAVYPFFKNARATEVKSRPVYVVTFVIVVVNKNLSSEAKAAADTYSLLTAVRDAIHSNDLGLNGIDVFQCTDISLVGYEAGEIAYSLEFQTKLYLPA